ncbi:MAG: aminotransferase class I/II-fold pyridoxal phosphate-dependent enzyme [archaeon]
MDTDETLDKIKPIIKAFYSERLAEWDTFDPDKDPVPVGWPIYDDEEVAGVLKALLEFRLSKGPYVKAFEEEYAVYQQTKHATAVNSGTSANIIAIQCLIEKGLLKKGQEIIIPAATFSAVASPILQNGCIPVYVDVEKDSYNIDPKEVEKAISDKTGAIMPVHSLGNPCDIEAIMAIAQKHNLPVIEDLCESHGAMVKGKKLGSFGTISALSFFVAHNMTTGEGGMIFTDDPELDSIAKSLREFGRIQSDERYPEVNKELGRYDRRYVFELVGYNMRMADPTAAFGSAQLRKLDAFNETRRKNAAYLVEGLKPFEAVLQLPSEHDEHHHTYYGFVLVVKDGKLSRNELSMFLNEKRIENRPFLAGSLPDQPAFKDAPGRVVGDLPVSRWLRDNAVFVGCHPLLDKPRLDYIIEVIGGFVKKHTA